MHYHLYSLKKNRRKTYIKFLSSFSEREICNLLNSLATDDIAQFVLVRYLQWLNSTDSLASYHL